MTLTQTKRLTTKNAKGTQDMTEVGGPDRTNG